MNGMDLKAELHQKLRASRAVMLARVEGLSEYNMRRPMTPTGTNLLGLIKHLAGVEYVYFGDSLGRPAPEMLAWNEDGSVWDGADMWAKDDETSDYLIGLYRRACEHGDQTIDALDLDAAAHVPHWPGEGADTTLGVLLIHMLEETAHHAGHADIVREMVDGRPGSDERDEAGWQTYVAQIQGAADTFAD